MTWEKIQSFIFILTTFFFLRVSNSYGKEIFYPTESYCQHNIIEQSFPIPETAIFNQDTHCVQPSGNKIMTKEFYYCCYASYYTVEIGNGKCMNMYYGCAGSYSIVRKSGWEPVQYITFNVPFDCPEPNQQFGPSQCD